jgi:NADH-quinone oxidoreductase subunit L
MTVALGASAYSAAIFHLMTHAFFKALLFLGAGSVIIAMHHEQDMRKMGGLRKYMPITYHGADRRAGQRRHAALRRLLLQGLDHRGGAPVATPGAGFAYFALLAGVFVGGFYSFRLVFFAFHGKERFREAPAHDATTRHGHDAHGA